MTSVPTARAPDLDQTTAFFLALAAPESVGVIDTLGVTSPDYQRYLSAFPTRASTNCRGEARDGQ